MQASATAMRKFARTHWKTLIAILLAIALATLTYETDSATRAPDVSSRLKAHVQAIVAHVPRHVEASLREDGYTLRRQGGNLEAVVANVAAGARPERVFIVGANGSDSEAAAVLELARLLKGLRPSRGTEVRFVFFSGKEEARDSFIAFAGSLGSSVQARQALAAFRSQPDVPAQGLAARAHVMGVTWSGHAGVGKAAYPALMVMDTAFVRYPYFQTAWEPQGTLDYEGMARVVQGLAQTIRSLAATVEA